MQNDNKRLSDKEKNFVLTDEIKKKVDDARVYLNAGLPVHFQGCSGVGKTSLALYLANSLDRPYLLIYGNEDYTSTDLVGTEGGLKFTQIMDNYVQSVKKTEEILNRTWIDERLALACKYGYTLIYDEFTRSKPETNNIFLAILEEKLLAMPTIRSEGEFMDVHQDFRLILTSNPEEYAGVYKSQDALLDRVVTIKLNQYSVDTEVAIIEKHVNIQRSFAWEIALAMRKIREICDSEHQLSIRKSIMLAKIWCELGYKEPLDSETMVRLAQNILSEWNLEFNQLQNVFSEVAK